MKTLLLIGGGIEAIPVIERAKAMQLFVAVADGDCNAPGRRYADAFWEISTYDALAMAKQALAAHYGGHPIHGVLAACADVPLTVAIVAQALRLPGPSIHTGFLTSDKFAMKTRLREAGIPIPWFARCWSLEDLKTTIVQRGYPLVLKPVDSRGARGVLRLTHDVDLTWAFDYSTSFSPSGRVMVEEYLAGPQISTESILCASWAETPGCINRNYIKLEAYAPHMIEDGGEQPTALSSADHAAVCTVAEQAAHALGIYRGTAKGDIVLTKDGPKVIEIAARLSGGWMSTRQIPLATGVDMVGIAIRLALGEDIARDEAMPRYHKGIAIRYFWPAPGRSNGIKGMYAARAFDGVVQLDVGVKSGDIIPTVTNHTQRAGFVITTGATRDEAVARAEAVVRMVHIETEKA